MRHAKLQALLSEFLDGQLDAGTAARLEAHLGRCAECRGRLDALRATVSLLRGLPPVESPPDVTGVVLARLRAGEGHSRWPERALARAAGWLEAPWGAPLAAAAVGLAVVVLVQGPLLPPAGSPTARSSPPMTSIRTAEVRSGAEVRATGPRSLGSGFGLVGAAEVAAVGIPPIHTCLEGPAALERGCERWHAWLVDLGTRDAPAFLTEMDAVPSRLRERWLSQLSHFAAHSGAASQLASELRASGDPRASRFARRFERVSLAER